MLDKSIIAELANPGILELKPYVPGKTIEEVKRHYGVNDIIKLASNENPLGPSPKALEAIRTSAINLALYPDSTGYQLKEKLSKKFLLPPHRFTLGNGSDEIFNIIYSTFINAEDEVILSQYGFAAFSVLAHSHAVKIVTVPEKNYTVDLPGMLKAITQKTKAIFIANPNNPTGTCVLPAQLQDFLKQLPAHILVILDEAYVEFAENLGDYPNTLVWLDQFPNLIITRTFSKAYGLAGLRVGFAIADERVTELMNRVKQPFNVNALAQIAAMAALEDTEHLRYTLENNKKGLLQWRQALDSLQLSYIPSACNFITVDLKQESESISHQLLSQGVIVRPLKPYQMPNHMRITVGTERENRRAIEALKTALKALLN